MATIGALRTGKRTMLLTLLLAAALLYLSLLGSKSLWFDEAFSVTIAQMPERIWEPSSTRPETHPPLYYQGLYYWIRWFGDSETAVRLPSAFVSLVNVALIYVLGKRLFNQRVGLIAAALLALSPLHVWYAQEARMYIFMTAVTLLSAVLLTWDSWWSFLPLAGTFTLGLYIDYTMLPIWILLSALWLVWWWDHGHARSRLVVWAAASVTSWLLFLPWLQNFYDVLAIFNDIHIFLRFHELIGVPFFSPEQYLLILVAVGVMLVPGAWVLKEAQRRPKTKHWLSAAVIIMFLLATLLFPIPRLYSVKRLIIQVWPLFVVWVAWMLDQAGVRRHRLVQSLVVVSLAASLVTLIGVPKDDWRSAVSYVNGRATEGDLVFLNPPFNRMATSYYDLVPPATARSEDVIKAQNAETIWFFAHRFPGEPIPSTSGEALMDEKYELVEAVPFYRLEVRGYRSSDQN